MIKNNAIADCILKGEESGEEGIVGVLSEAGMFLWGEFWETHFPEENTYEFLVR